MAFIITLVGYDEGGESEPQTDSVLVVSSSAAEVSEKMSQMESMQEERSLAKPLQRVEKVFPSGVVEPL